jgi:hypothetical protein
LGEIKAVDERLSGDLKLWMQRWLGLASELIMQNFSIAVWKSRSLQRLRRELST